MKWVVILAVLGYGGLLALMTVFQRALVYFPDPKRTAPAQAGLPQAEEISLTSSDGEKLIAWFVPPREGKPLVIYFQGNAGALGPARRALQMVERRRHRAARAVLSRLWRLERQAVRGRTDPRCPRGLRFRRARVRPNASSCSASRSARPWPSRWPPSARSAPLILDAPFTSAADVGAAAYPFAPVRWLMKDQFRSDLRIGKVKVPILMLHGGQDTIVPARFGEALFALAPEPKRMVRFPAGGHVNLDDFGAIEVVKEFLARLPRLSLDWTTAVNAYAAR